MIMNGCEVRVGFSGDAERALTLIAEELAKLGYVLKTQEPDKLKMSFSGKLLTTDPDKVRHSVTVSRDGAALLFEFSTGIVASYWTESDKAWARARAEDVTAAVRSRLDG